MLHEFSVSLRKAFDKNSQKAPTFLESFYADNAAFSWIHVGHCDLQIANYLGV